MCQVLRPQKSRFKQEATYPSKHIKSYNYQYAVIVLCGLSFVKEHLHIGQWLWELGDHHYNDVLMGAIASQITSLTIVYSTVYSDADQRKHQGSASLAFVREIHRGPVNSPHKWPVTRKMIPIDDVIMIGLDHNL